MMSICHPTIGKFALFHSIDKSWRETCHVLMVLKSAESFAHAMISALLPYLQWKISKEKGEQASPLIAKWFKPAAHACAADTYWDLHDECVKNASDRMLDLTNMRLMIYIGWLKLQPPPQNVSMPKLMMSCWMIRFQQ